MENYEKIKQLIKKRFERYQTYYQILSISANEATDEIVKEAYDKKCKEIDALLRHCEEEKVQEIREVMQDAFDDAYNALKDEQSRKNYQKLLDYLKGEDR